MSSSNCVFITCLLLGNFQKCTGTFFKSISLSLREVLFLVFRKNRLFSRSRNAKFAKSTSSFHDFPTLRIGCNRQNNVGTLFLTEIPTGRPDVTNCALVHAPNSDLY
jgi:hypothetical protein